MAVEQASNNLIIICHRDLEISQSIEDLMRTFEFDTTLLTSSVEVIIKLGDKNTWNRCVGGILEVDLADGKGKGVELARWIREREKREDVLSKHRKRLVGVTAFRAQQVIDSPFFDYGTLTPYSPSRLLRVFLNH